MINVSIHALARSATVAVLNCKTAISGFNPRARTERDVEKNGAKDRYLMVSIHALARSATLSFTGISAYFIGFNPRARTERDSFTSNYIKSRTLNSLVRLTKPSQRVS